MSPLYLCLIGLLIGVGLWLLYRGRILILPFSRRFQSRRADLLLGVFLAGVSVLLLGLGCRLAIAYVTW